MIYWSGWTDYDPPALSADLRPTGDRSGLHLSDVIHSMKVAAGEKVGAIEGDQPGTRMMEGFVWESALEYIASGMGLDEALETAFRRHMLAWRKDVCKQVTLEKDGVRMTPDGFIPGAGELESWKCTRRSFKKAARREDFEENFWPWVVQEQSYCYALGVDTVSWIVLFQAGDYGKGVGTGPVVKRATATFGADELAANWAVVMEYAKGLR